MNEGTEEAYHDFLKMKRTLDALRQVIGSEALNAFLRSLKDDGLHSWDQRQIIKDARPDLAGEILVSPIEDALKRIQDYRVKQKYSVNGYGHRIDPEDSPTLTGRWENRLNDISAALNRWRETVKVYLYFGSNADAIDGLQESLITKSDYGNKINVKIKVNSNIFTKVMPMFNSGEIKASHRYDDSERWDNIPQVERLGNTRTGKYFQYLVFDAGDPVFDYIKDGEIKPMENGIRAYPIKAIEVVGPLGDRNIELADRKWLAFMDRHIGENTVTGVHDSPAKAYSLVRQRIYRDMVAQL